MGYLTFKPDFWWRGCDEDLWEFKLIITTLPDFRFEDFPVLIEAGFRQTLRL